MSERIQHWLKFLTRYSDRWWYELLMMLASAADAYVLLVPNEPILAAAVLAKPRRWLRIALLMALGSAIGALSLAALIEHWSGWILSSILSSRLLASKEWHRSVMLVSRHGWWGLTLASVGPFPQHAAVIIVGLLGMPLVHVFFAILVGRAVKYAVIGWLTAHSPKALKKLRSRRK